MARLLLVDDHPLFRAGFASMVKALRPEWALQFAGASAEALSMLQTSLPDLAIVDIVLPDMDGFMLVKATAHFAPHLPQALISGRSDAGARARAMACGARGLIAKTEPPEVIAGCLDVLLAGGRTFGHEDQAAPALRLTARQAEVLSLLAGGHGNKEIRYRLQIAERTVRSHLTELFHLLGVQSRTQALIRARELGLLP